MLCRKGYDPGGYMKSKYWVPAAGCAIFLLLLWSFPYLMDGLGAFKTTLGIPSVPTNGWQCISWNKTPEACSSMDATGLLPGLEGAFRNGLRYLFSFSWGVLFVLMVRPRLDPKPT